MRCSKGYANVYQEDEIDAEIQHRECLSAHVVWLKGNLEGDGEAVEDGRHHDDQVPLALEIVVRPEDELTCFLPYYLEPIGCFLILQVIFDLIIASILSLQ